MGFSMNTVYLSGQIVDFTEITPVDLGSGVPLQKTTILVQYTDTNNGKHYKIPIEILAGENKINLIKVGLIKGNFMSLDGRLVSSQYLNKNTQKEVTFLKVEPYTINFPNQGQQIIMKNRFTGNMVNGYSGGNSPYKNMTTSDAQQAIQEKIDSMKSQPQPPKPQPAGYPSNIDLEEPIPF